MALYERKKQLPIPPTTAEQHNTVCQYCNVGCGYKVYVWPEGQDGGAKPGQNAMGIDFSKPQPPLSGQSYTESMYSTITKKDGRQYSLAIVPAHDSPINLQGQYSTRGGTNALTTWSPNRPTRERLQYPLLRIGDYLQVVPWETAVEVMAGVTKGLLDKHGPNQLTAKCFDHGGGGGGFENTWGTGSLFFTGLKMQYVGIHNRPAYTSEVAGTRDRGIHELNYTAQDGRLADTIVLWGANSYETASVFFTAHMLPNFQGSTADEKKRVFDAKEPADDTRVIVVDPRRTSTVALLQSIDAKRVLHVRPNLGSDYMLANAVARVVWERGYYNKAYLQARTDMGATFKDYQSKSLELGLPYAAYMTKIEGITGVPRAQIEQMAALIGQPKSGGSERRSLIIYEKGVIWNFRQYDVVAAIAQLGALTHSVGRPGTGVGRQGGHQEGYARPGYPGPNPPPDVDKYIEGGGGKLFYVVGCNPYLSAQNNQYFRSKIHSRTEALSAYLSGQTASAGEPPSTAAMVARILEGLDKTDGLFMVVQDLYMIESAHDAHLVLPVAGWGEADLTSINCNSRLLRLYEKFMDPPGEAKPDWEISGLIGQKLHALYQGEGNVAMATRFAGMDWKSGAEVFLAAQAGVPDNTVSAADEATLDAQEFKGVTYAMLKKLGQKGIQTPVRRDPATKKLVGTVRRFSYRFGTPDGKLSWYGTRAWDGYPPEVAKYLSGAKAQEYPFWLSNGRNQLIWQTMYHDRYLPEKMNALPMPYVEVHPQDAARLGIKAGDIVELYNEEGNETFMVYVDDAPKPGMLFAIMYHPRGTSNSLTSTYTDPLSVNPWYKGTRAGMRKLDGTIPDILRTASFLPRNKFD
jgi:arsenite oxidase large subunit